MSYEQQTSRRRRARRQRQKQSGSWFWFIIVVLLALSFWWFWPQNKNQVKKVKVAKQAKKETPSFTVAVFGVEKQDNVEKATGVLLLTYNQKKKLVGGLLFDQNTFIDIPGKGFIQAKDGLSEPTKAASALGEVAKVSVKGYLILPKEKFAYFVSKLTPARFFTDYTSSGINKLKLVEYAKTVQTVPKKKVLIVFLPVKPLTIGETTYYQPVKKDLNKLTAKFWGARRVNNEARVIILNGNGIPGIARSAADKLLACGFRIVDIKNAANFNYQKTEIIAYTSLGKQKTSLVKKSLQVGVVKLNQIPQDVTDLVVILGKDYQQ